MGTTKETKPQNPPAFPNNEQATDSWGMDLRDYFAAKAMQAIITGLWSDENTKAIDDDVISKRAYDYAHAMLKEREKEV